MDALTTRKNKYNTSNFKTPNAFYAPIVCRIALATTIVTPHVIFNETRVIYFAGFDVYIQPNQTNFELLSLSQLGLGIWMHCLHRIRSIGH